MASENNSLQNQPSTPERSSEPSLEEKFPVPASNDLSVPGTDVHMVDSGVANIRALNEFESLEDQTVYEVVTECQNAPQGSNTDYPHINLQLCDGQIINAKNGEIIINLLEFVANDESDTSFMFFSQRPYR